MAREVMLRALVGSQAYGTALPGAPVHDVDYVEVYRQSPEWYWGLDAQAPMKGDQTFTVVDGVTHDTTTYLLQHFAKLAMAGNPAVLPVLWVDKYETLSEAGRVLVTFRHVFSSKLVHTAFTGMARNAQREFAKSVTNGQPAWKQAMHTLRLSQMVYEFLQTGELWVDRTELDAPYLQAVRAGRCGVEDVDYEMAKALQKADDALEFCTLPDQPDTAMVNTVLVMAMGG